jgi:hypothetical protein
MPTLRLQLARRCPAKGTPTAQRGKPIGQRDYAREKNTTNRHFYEAWYKGYKSAKGQDYVKGSKISHTVLYLIMSLRTQHQAFLFILAEKFSP